jgi:hypothetical protein
MSRALTWCWRHERMAGNKVSSILYATTQIVKVAISFIVTLYIVYWNRLSRIHNLPTKLVTASSGCTSVQTHAVFKCVYTVNRHNTYLQNAINKYRLSPNFQPRGSEMGPMSWCWDRHSPKSIFGAGVGVDMPAACLRRSTTRGLNLAATKLTDITYILVTS